MSIELGDTVRETILGYEGTVTSITEYLYGCRRATIELRGKDGDVKEYTFDEPRLERVPTKAKRTPKQDTGGDRPAMPRTGVAP